MSTLKVPFAFDIDHNLVKADVAEKDQQYFCPGCEEILILKKGEKKAAHYAHKESDICTHRPRKGPERKIAEKPINSWIACGLLD